MAQTSQGLVMVTGASGFIGRALSARLLSEGVRVRGVVRRSESAVPYGTEKVIVHSIEQDTNWSPLLKGVDTVVHLAARVHVIKERTADPLHEFRKVNVAGTERLAQMSLAAGVRRIVYVSSIGVNGEITSGKAFTEEDVPSPCSPYAISKWEAEEILRRIGNYGAMEVVIVRPPLVYGPHAPGNFGRMVRLIKSGLPLPFGGVKNMRSLIYLGNLVDALVKCIQREEAAGRTFLISDGEDISTPDMIRMIAKAMGVKERLVTIPEPLLMLMGNILRKRPELEKLVHSLCIDSSKIRRVLNWIPPFTIEEGIRETVRWIGAR